MSRRRWLLAALLCPLLLIAGCRQGNPPIRADDYQESPAMANVHLGAAYLRKGDLERALIKLQKAIKQDPRLPAAYDVLGLVYERLGDPATAERHFTRAVELGPGDSSAHNNYGQFLCKSGRTEAGVKHLERALENRLYKTPEVAAANAGICLVRGGDPEGAERFLRRALGYDPRYSPALLEMARLSEAQDKMLQARAFLQRYHLVAPHSAESLALGIRIERELGDRNAVANYFLRLKTHFPQSEEARELERGDKP